MNFQAIEMLKNGHSEEYVAKLREAVNAGQNQRSNWFCLDLFACLPAGFF